MSSPAGVRKDPVDNGGEGIGDQNFFAEPEREAPHPFEDVVDGELPDAELLVHLGIADDRPGDELGKERFVRAEIDERFARRHPPRMDIGEIRDRLEREEGDAERQADGVMRRDEGEPEIGRDAARHRQQEVRVLEDDQAAEIGAEPGDEPAEGDPRRSLGDDEADRPVDDDVVGEDEDVQSGVDEIEEDAEGEKDGVPRPRRCKHVEGENDRQEGEEKDWGAKTIWQAAP